MTYENIRALIILLLITFIFFGVESKISGAVSASEVGNLLSQKDQICDSEGYIISFTLTTKNHQFNDPNQGMKIMHCQATKKDDEFALKVENQYEHDPVYGVVGTYNYGPYDYNGKNLIVWRTMAEYILSTPQRNDVLKELKFYLVSPGGKVIQTGDNVKLERWKIGDSSSTMYLYIHFKRACGRGLSSDIGNVESTEILTDGKVKCISSGSRGPGIPSGKWEITLDPDSDYLARKAVFFKGDEFVGDEHKGKPIVQVVSSGLIEKDGLTFAKSGVLNYSDLFEFSAEVKSISKVFLINWLYRKVVGKVEDLPSGASIYDMRTGVPVTTKVK